MLLTLSIHLLSFWNQQNYFDSLLLLFVFLFAIFKENETKLPFRSRLAAISIRKPRHPLNYSYDPKAMDLLQFIASASRTNSPEVTSSIEQLNEIRNRPSLFSRRVYAIQ
jgi:hypothetical protein